MAGAKRSRLREGWTQQEAAGAGVTQAYLSMVEHGAVCALHPCRRQWEILHGHDGLPLREEGVGAPRQAQASIGIFFAGWVDQDSIEQLQSATSLD